MKNFSFLLVGFALLGIMAFTLAEDSQNLGALTESMAGMPSTINNSLNSTSENNTGNIAETTTGDTTEISETNTATTGNDAELTTGTTVETTTGDTAEAITGDTTETVETTENTEIITGDNTIENHETNSVIISDSAKQTYDEEQIAAYEWAFDNGITTIANVEDARLADGLTRAELAKMMSQYLTRVLGGAPAIGEVEYSDVDESLGDLVDYIKMAYAYKIMGVNVDGTPLEEFNPNGIVTRAEFATVFSRVLYGDNYNRYEGNYYEGHLIALKNAGILTNISPTIQEVRGWVMLMMYRSTNPTSEKPEEGTVDEGTGEVVGIANPASEYCVAQGGTVNNVKDAEGNESGICKLSDGTEIDEWEYYRANNPENSTGNTVEIPEETDGTGEVMSGSTLTITVTPG